MKDLRLVKGSFGIRAERGHWRCFDDNGDFAGEFFNQEAARWGCWISEAEARRINEGEHRLIIMDDVSANIRAQLSQLEPPNQNGPTHR